MFVSSSLCVLLVLWKMRLRSLKYASSFFSKNENDINLAVTSKGPSIKYVRKNLPIFDPPPPPVRSAYALVWTPPLPPLYARTQFSWIYKKYNTELVNRFFNANILIFNYNMIFIKYKYICWILKKCVRTQQLWPPLPPCTQCVRIGLDPPPPPCVRTLWMYKWPVLYMYVSSKLWLQSL